MLSPGYGESVGLTFTFSTCRRRLMKCGALAPEGRLKAGSEYLCNLLLTQRPRHFLRLSRSGEERHQALDRVAILIGLEKKLQTFELRFSVRDADAQLQRQIFVD